MCMTSKGYVIPRSVNEPSALTLPMMEEIKLREEVERGTLRNSHLLCSSSGGWRGGEDFVQKRQKMQLPALVMGEKIQ